MPATADSPRLKALKLAPFNSWIALSDDESFIIAVGNTYAEVSKKLEESGHPDSIVLKTPSSWAPLSV
jgi:hypothetical protein